jgi:Dolichyl-phosphate-mannose-protein mannosyltransferase
MTKLGGLDHPTKSGAPQRVPAWSWVVLLLILVLDVWWRCHTIGPTVRHYLGFAPWPVVSGEAEPLDCDEAAYGYIARRLTHGAVMYRDVSENKPPLGYWLYAAAVAIGGANELTIRLMPIPYVLATIALVWWLGLRLRGPSVACLAAFLYAILSTDPYLFGNGANMEHFINLFAVGSLAAMVRSLEVPGRRWLVVAGALVGAASMVKQVAALHGLIYAVALVLVDRKGLLFLPPPSGRGAGGEGHGTTNDLETRRVRTSIDRRGPSPPAPLPEGEGRQKERPPWAVRVRSRFADLLALAGGFAAIWTVAVAILWLQGAGPSAFDDIVSYGSALATIKVPEPHAPAKLVRWFVGNADPDGHLPPPFGKTRYLVWWARGSWPLWLAAVPSTVWLLVGRGRSRRLVGAWTLSAWVQVALPGLFWQHYYLVPTPGVALVVAVAMGDVVGAVGSSFRLLQLGRLLVGTIVGLFMLLSVELTLQLQVRDYLMVAPEDLTSRFKGGRQWVVLRAMGRELAHRSKAWENPSLYVWGWQSPLFIYSGLDGPTRHFFADPLLEDYSKGYHRDDPRVRPRVERIMRDLEARPPSMILVAYPPFPELKRYLDSRTILTRIQVLGQTMPLHVASDGFARFEALGAQTAGAANDMSRPASAR